MGVKVNCELLRKNELVAGIFKYTVKAPEIAKEAKPGQFLEIKVSETGEPYLRRPISIFNIDGENVEHSTNVGSTSVYAEEADKYIEMLYGE